MDVKKNLVSGSHLVSEGDMGSFTVNLTGLEPNTTYYLKAYAINSAGVAYGSEVSFTTQPGLLMINVIEEEGFVHDGSVVDGVSPIKFGFEMSSFVGLNKLEITFIMEFLGVVVENKWAEMTFDGETSYTYIYDGIIGVSSGQVTFTATVWDEESRSNTASLTIQLGNMTPTISVIEENGYLTDNQVVDMDVEYTFGFYMTSSTAELSSLTINIDDGDYLQVFDIVDLSGMNEYYYVSTVFFASNKDIIGEYTFIAEVTDVNGRSNSASFTVYVNQQGLLSTPFVWVRTGAAEGVGLEEFGLSWQMNSKEAFARIRPLDGVTLMVFDPSVWNEVTTDMQKAALFSGSGMVISEYANVSVWNSNNYNDVIGTILPNGSMRLIHVTNSVVTTFKGMSVAISGEWK